MKDMNARDFYANMNDTLGSDYICYSTVTKYFREKSFPKPILDTDFKPKIEAEHFIDKAILGAIEECPFSLLRQIAKGILFVMSMI
jgi:hypothetical protein